MVYTIILLQDYTSSHFCVHSMEVGSPQVSACVLNLDTLFLGYSYCNNHCSLCYWCLLLLNLTNVYNNIGGKVTENSKYCSGAALYR